RSYCVSGFGCLGSAPCLDAGSHLRWLGGQCLCAGHGCVGPGLLMSRCWRSGCCGPCGARWAAAGTPCPSPWAWGHLLRFCGEGRSGGMLRGWSACLLQWCMWCLSWLLGSSVVLVLLCPSGALHPGCLSVWGVPSDRVASIGLRGVPVLWYGSVFRSQPDTSATIAIRSYAVIWVPEVAGPVFEAVTTT
ncbi:hypothetical protein LDENG_00241440, partial [Lucifuga dentata]